MYNISKAKHKDWGTDWSLGNIYLQGMSSERNNEGND